jgi:hypothetical protein
MPAHKEPIAIRSLTELFSGGRFRRRNNVKIPEITDIDFVVYEVVTGFLLLIQHKWLVPPETVDESSANDEHLAIGIRQAIDSRKYVIEHPEFLRQRLDLDDSAAISRIEATVVCRGFEHTGFFDDKGIPMIMEVAFRELVQNSENLPTLWSKLALDQTGTQQQRKLSILSDQYILPNMSSLSRHLGGWNPDAESRLQII